MISFSVIIPTYQRPKDLARCLDQLAPGTQTLPFGHYEVIVTDDEGDGSETQKLVQNRYPWAQWVAGPGRGPAANRNNGAAHAQGDWLVFTDDDCIPQKDWLSAYSDQILEDTSFNVFEGATLPEGPKHSLAWEAPINEQGGVLWSCNFAIKRSLFLRLEGFAEDYPFALEDIDFRTRLDKAGEQWLFLPEASVVHPWRPRRPFFRQVKDLEGWIIYFKKHPDVLEGFNWGYLARPFITAWQDIRGSYKHHKAKGLPSYIGSVVASFAQALIVIGMKLFPLPNSNEAASKVK